MTKKQQIKLAQNTISKGKEFLDDWIDICKSYPYKAFNFFTDAMVGNAKIHVGEMCLTYATNDGDLSVLANRELQITAKYPTRSTGVLDLEIKQYVISEWAQLLQKIEAGETQ